MGAMLVGVGLEHLVCDIWMAELVGSNWPNPTRPKLTWPLGLNPVNRAQSDIALTFRKGNRSQNIKLSW